MQIKGEKVLENQKKFLPLQSRAIFKRNGSLAQLVQSVCLTSRGSGVRIPQLPHRKSSTYSDVGACFFFRRYTISTQLCFNPLPFLCLFCPILEHPIGKNFACSAAGNLSYIASSASGNRIGYAKVFRDKGERGDNWLSPAGSSALRVGTECRPHLPMQKIAPATARYFRLCTVPRPAT